MSDCFRKIESNGTASTRIYELIEPTYNLHQGKNAKELARTVVHLLAPFKGYVKSITTDNETEFACPEMIAKSIGTKVYFADPYSSWQKGAIENVNGLIRQYIPKNTSFSNINHQQITKIMHKINTRPRENSISQHQESAFMKRFRKFALAS